MAKSMRPGGGGRFAKGVAAIKQRGGATNPAAVMAVAGRRKYGQAQMTKWSVAGRKRAK